MAIHLFVDQGSRRELHAFPGPAVTIGRADDNDLRILSRLVSQHHCRIEPAGDQVRVVDLNSRNGTWVNGEQAGQRTLSPGDRIEIGPVTLWFEEAPEEITTTLDPDADLETPTPSGAVTVTARTGSGLAGELEERLRTVFMEYQKSFGDERGLVEIERGVRDASARLFPKPAFAEPVEAQKLFEINKAILSELNLDRCLALILDTSVRLTEAERGFVILRTEPDGIRVRIARNFDQEAIQRADFKFSRSIAEEVVRTGVPVLSHSAQDDRRFDESRSVAELRLRSILCVPFQVRGRVIGALYLDNRFKSGIFTERERSLLERLADQAAIAIENARLYAENLAAREEIEKSRAELIELNRILETRLRERETELHAIRTEALAAENFRHDYSAIIGRSAGMIGVFRLLDKVVSSDMRVLILGESGTGKELIARAIHENSPRRDGPFVKENCAAIPETLLESELFGYRRGAFTGANQDKTGLFEEAHRGTIFLDEIGETSLEMQKKLLRTLQESEVRPVGARAPIRIDVRVIAASNRDLKRLVEEGRFRDDLYYRLNEISVQIPPLRERLEDIPALIEHFLAKWAAKSADRGEAPRTIDPLAIEALMSYHWPGNVRELENEIQRACALSGPIITVADLSSEITAGREFRLPSGAGDLRDIVRRTASQKEREIILRTLEETGWKKSLAARKLGISRPTLDGRIRQFGLEEHFRRRRES